MVQVGKGFSQNLKLLCSSREESPACLQSSIPVCEGENIHELGLPSFPTPGIPLLQKTGRKGCSGLCTQALPFVGGMLMCHSSVSASDSVKHSAVLAALKHCELSDTDKSSPTLTAATLQPLNSALKFATH